MKLCCFVVTAFFGPDSTLRVTAGTSADQAQNPNQWFTLNPREDDPAAIVGEILAKIKDALEQGRDGIDVNTDGRIILKAPLDIARDATDRSGRGIVVSAPRTVVAKDPLINPNTATEEELRSLPGVGPVIARKIVTGRPYRSVDDLLKVAGIGPDKMTDIKPRVTVD
jgi:DNA uptake protein ComE-like DNA-binding protein